MKYKGNELVCLVPREGKSGITSHEKTLCDCEVIEILKQLKAAKGTIIAIQKIMDVKTYNALDVEMQKHLTKYLEK